MLAHLTPLEAPLVWVVFFAGLLLGSLGTLVVVRGRRARRTAP